MRTFKVFHEHLGDEGEEVQAFNAEYAAADWVEEHESGNAEYPLLERPGCNSEEVTVEDENGVRTKWRVFGESRPHYWAKPEKSKE